MSYMVAYTRFCVSNSIYAFNFTAAIIRQSTADCECEEIRQCHGMLCLHFW